MLHLTGQPSALQQLASTNLVGICGRHVGTQITGVTPCVTITVDLVDEQRSKRGSRLNHWYQYAQRRGSLWCAHCARSALGSEQGACHTYLIYVGHGGAVVRTVVQAIPASGTEEEDTTPLEKACAYGLWI